MPIQYDYEIEITNCEGEIWKSDGFSNLAKIANFLNNRLFFGVHHITEKILNKPIIFHSRFCADETIRILKEERAYEVGGAMHYFQSNNKIASELESMGFKISIGKPLLRIKKLENVINSININNIIVETDSAPQPFKKDRSKWTEPKDCNLIIDKISKIKCENVRKFRSFFSC